MPRKRGACKLASEGQLSFAEVEEAGPVKNYRVTNKQNGSSAIIPSCIFDVLFNVTEEEEDAGEEVSP